MELLITGILLGMGASIPLGPVNLEIIRRNLRFGTSFGIAMGLGACIADVTYLVLLCLGALTLMNYPGALKIISFVGALILAWFAINAFRSTMTDIPDKKIFPSLWGQGIGGYFITLVNPYTILFWASVSSQISIAASKSEYAVWLAGCGVVIGTVGWVIILNTIIHFTRHRLTPRTIKWLNYSGGFILLAFAVTGMIRAFN